MEASGFKRVAGLDLWRAGLMAFGLFYHALPVGDGRPLFVAIGYLSSHFRMGAFFAISGFLTGILAPRHDPRIWLRRRFARLLPPLVTGLCLIVPSMALLSPTPERGAAGIAATLFDWHHLWFLAAMIGYVPIGIIFAYGPAGMRLIGILGGFARLLGSMQAALIVLLSIASFALLALGADIIDLVPLSGSTVLKFLPLMLCYVPIYATGILFGRFEAFRAHGLATVWRPALAIAVLVCADAILGKVIPASRGDLLLDLDAFMRATMPVPGALLILRSALAIRRVPAPIARLSDAAMTVYIVHLPLVVLLERETAVPSLDPYVRYLIVVALAGALSLLVHLCVVRRSRTLSWLFNGDPRPRRPAQPSGAPAPRWRRPAC